MTSTSLSTAPGPARSSWRRWVAVAALVFVGLCELLSTTSSIEWGWAPRWLSLPIVMTGFLAFLILAGFTSLVGNLFVGVLVFLLIRRHWGWPLWRALLVASPYWICFYRIIPKPW